MAFKRLLSLFDTRITPKEFLRDFSYYSLAILPWIPAVIFFNDHVGEIKTINGASMYPYLNTSFDEDLSRDTCWVNKYNSNKDLRRGMIVSFRSPNHPEVLAIKRVIALEGDKVFTRAPCPYPTVHVPKNHIWVEGDNRDGRKSLDSNHYGPIPLNLISGRVTHVLSPWSSFGPIRWWEFKGRTRVIEGKRDLAPRWD